jgi:three-Cys-motif partner protein
MKHEFGGLWTRKKITILRDYLEFYTKALKNKHFKLHYVDAFAGTGIHNQKVIESQQYLISHESFKGSVLTALDITPGFSKYHFNDLDPKHVKALHEIKENNPTKNIEVSELDANKFVTNFCGQLQRGDRAVIFIDPFNTELEWKTLEVIAKSQKVDLWLLFPLSALLRMTPKDGDKIIPAWEVTITRLVGTPEWKTALYKTKPQPVIKDMFDTEIASKSERINPEELQLWVKKRLEEIFSFVAQPVPLSGPKNAPLFSFFFAVANPSKAAWGLAQKVATHIISKNY